MKALKVILYIVLAIVLLGAAAVFMIPTEYHVERSTTINAPQKLIMQHAGKFENFVKWSPWNKLDPNMTYTIEGTDGEVGSRYSWVGNDQVGEGSMEITSVSENKIEEDLIFLKPFESRAKVSLTFETTSDGTKVTWAMDSESPRPMNLMNPMMDGMMGPDFESGLAELKVLSEKVASSDTFRSFKIEPIEMSSRTYIGIKDTVKWADMQTFMASSFGAAYGELTKKKAPMAGAPSSIYFVWDEANEQTVMAAAIPVEGEYSLDGFEAFPAGGSGYKIAYYGAYEGSGEAHYAMDDYFTAKGLEMTEDIMVIEEYVTDPTTEADTSKWLTNVYYILK
ncbi:MAG: SRPBCC family protein [Imperialibacter sp.]|uniref:SRPBCC family protein n=1 Tax=Imperialibacter sp. TaxID=2038411 RepID=UPI0032EF302F